MDIIIAFMVGAIIGAGVMFFVCRKNAKTFAEKEAELKAELATVKAKAGKIKDIVKG